MLFSQKRIPTYKLFPIQYRKILKKLLLLEVGVSLQGRKLWRSVFGTMLSLIGIYILIGLVTDNKTEDEILNLILPLVGLFFTFVFFILIYEWLYVWTYFYDLDEHFLRIRKGVLIRREVSIPYNRIHDVYLDQDILDHIFQLYDLYVATASEISYAEAHIDGLNRANSHNLRDKLLEKIQQSKPGNP